MRISSESDIEELAEFLRNELSTNGISTDVDIWRFNQELVFQDMAEEERIDYLMAKSEEQEMAEEGLEQ